MRTTLLLLLVISGISVAHAADHPKFNVGVDFSLPFTLAVDGQGNSGRGNFNLGFEGRHWFSESANWGIRFGADMDEHRGITRKFSVGPGLAQHWLTNENWRPFVRLDLPVILRGAPNNRGSDSEKDLGISGGTGFVWKLGDAIGLRGMEFRYDFDFFYYIGIGPAVSVIGMDLFRLGLDYRF